MHCSHLVLTLAAALTFNVAVSSSQTPPATDSARKQAPPPKGLKSPVAAFALSALLTPGAGQAYNGQWGKGLAFFGGFALGSVIVSVSALECAFVDSGDCGSAADALAAGTVLMLGSWIWSAIDAPMSSVAINRQLRRGVTLGIEPRVLAFTPSASGIGVTNSPRGRLASTPSLGLSLATLRF